MATPLASLSKSGKTVSFNIFQSTLILWQGHPITTVTTGTKSFLTNAGQDGLHEFTVYENWPLDFDLSLSCCGEDIEEGSTYFLFSATHGRM